MAEFLPICDVLFNVISLAGYFCDIVFDMVFCYALMERGRTIYVGAVLFLVGSSLITSQVCYEALNTKDSRSNTVPCLHTVYVVCGTYYNMNTNK